MIRIGCLIGEEISGYRVAAILEEWHGASFDWTHLNILNLIWNSLSEFKVLVEKA
jgi:hypothetical protein